MAHRLNNRVRETSTTTGVGTYTLLGAASGYQALSGDMSTGDTGFFCMFMGVNYEVFLGTYTLPDQLARTYFYESSNGDAAVNWGSGTKTLIQVAPAHTLWPITITPSQIGANQDNYAPTGIATASLLRLSSDASRDVTGITSGYDGRRMTLINVGSYAIVLKNDVTSTAANRFLFGQDITLYPNDTIQLQYDATSVRWRRIATDGAGAVRFDVVQTLLGAQQKQVQANVGVPSANYLINGRFAIDEVNAGLTTATADNTAWADRWRYIGEATANLTARAVDFGAGRFNASLTFGGTTDKGGIFQVIRGANCKPLRSNAVLLSASLKVSNTRLGNIKMGIAEFTGTEDATTGDPVATWGADGVTPTLAAGWAFLNTPANLSVTTTEAVYSVTATVGASANNLAALIWNDDKSYNASDILYFSDVKLEEGAARTPYLPDNEQELLHVCQAYSVVMSSGNGAQGTIGFGFATSTTVAQIEVRLPRAMIGIPTLTSTADHWQLNDGAGATDLTALALLGAGASTKTVAVLSATVAAGLTVNRPYRMTGDAAALRKLVLSAEI